MKIAVVGSKDLQVEDLGRYLPQGVTEIISGRARGIDTCARRYALAAGLKLTEILPAYDKYGRFAPIRRNQAIVDSADEVLAFWDGRSRGTRYVIGYCQKRKKRITVFIRKRSE